MASRPLACIKRNMQALFFFVLLVASVPLAVMGCGGDGDTNDTPNATDSEFRVEMRSFVEEISAHGRLVRPGFIVVPQNGTELITTTGVAADPLETSYLDAISGVGREDLLYGYDNDDVATDTSETARLQGLLDLAEAHGVQALVTDYCWTPSKMDDSYARNAAKGYTSFAADRRDLDDIPNYPSDPYRVNADDITNLAQAKNFLYVLDQSGYASAEALVSALAATRYDLLIVDAFYNGTDPLTPDQLTTLKQKPGGGRRLVIAYMSIGEAENYRSYWQSQWTASPPSWLAGENPDWPGNYKVHYWDPAWKQIINGDGGYLDTILAQGFDGVYLDVIDAFEYFEN